MDELACFSETSRQRAFQHFELLRAHLEDGRSLAAIARETSLSYRTLQYWLERYRASGLVALARKPRTDRGRRRKLSAALQEVIRLTSRNGKNRTLRPSQDHSTKRKRSRSPRGENSLPYLIKFPFRVRTPLSEVRRPPSRPGEGSGRIPRGERFCVAKEARWMYLRRTPSSRTTKLYDRRGRKVLVEDMERLRY